MKESFFPYFLVILVSCMVVNAAKSAACHDEKYPEVKCTDIKLDYKGIYGVVAQAYITYTQCREAPGGPETTVYPRNSNDNHVCARVGTRIRIGQMAFRPNIDTEVTDQSDFNVLCSAGEDTFCKRVP